MKNLQVFYCVERTDGWQLLSNLKLEEGCIFDKPSFCSMGLADYVARLARLEEIELVGLCTGIYVISNALILKVKFPQVKITVDVNCCA